MTNNKDNIFYYIYFFFLLLQASQTLIPYSHGDALYYHLVGPKIWKESNWHSMWQDLVHYAQAGYFDLFYFIPTYFLESKDSDCSPVAVAKGFGVFPLSSWMTSQWSATHLWC